MDWTGAVTNPRVPGIPAGAGSSDAGPKETCMTTLTAPPARHLSVSTADPDRRRLKCPRCGWSILPVSARAGAGPSRSRLVEHLIADHYARQEHPCDDAS